jgi:2-polyprenyl-3-methyl-5-hydroxy-6-metoxy-1,4-benzoquinol methylase
MKRDLLEILRCPVCGGSLRDQAEGTSTGELTEGLLICESCAAAYPIRDGIPRFVAEAAYTDAFSLQWNTFRVEQLDSFNGTDISAGRVFTETGLSPTALNGQLILDVGCGAGRFVDAIAKHDCRVVGVDMSGAVDAARINLSGYDNVELVQADLFHLPFKPGSFDICYCIGVIQHTPDPRRAIRALPPVLKPDGLMALTMYARRPWMGITPKYLLRHLTTRVPQSVLLRAVRMVMPIAFPVTEVLFRIPVLGRLFRFLIPIANYVGEKRLTMRQRYRWAVLDTFDMLAPAWDLPLTEQEVIGQLESAGVDQIRPMFGGGLNLVGVKS